jgi:hypothetical protein
LEITNHAAAGILTIELPVVTAAMAGEMRSVLWVRQKLFRAFPLCFSREIGKFYNL